jgi:hypothetical protein
MSTYLSDTLDKKGLFNGLATEIKRTGRLTGPFLYLLTAVGLGKKRAAFLLRDLVWIYGLEDNIARADRLYVQPMDIWTLRAAASVFQQQLPDNRELDLAIAQMLSEACYCASVSGVAFNQGAWKFGNKKVGRGNDYNVVIEREMASP